MTKPGEQNGTCLGMIAERRITRKELNERVRSGEFTELHRELIGWALQGAGL